VKHPLDDLSVRLLGIATLVIIVAIFVLTVRVLLVPVVAALFLVYLYDPVIKSLQRQGVSPAKGYLLLLAISILAAINLIVYAPEWLRFESMGGSADTLAERLSQQASGFERFIDSRIPLLRPFDLAGQITERARSLVDQMRTALPALFASFALNLVLVPIIAFFMVKDGRKLRRKISSLLPNRYFEMASMMFYRIDLQIGGYLRGRLIECTLVAVIQVVLMTVVSLYIPQSQILLISFVGGLTNLIPYVGPILGGAFGVFLYLAAGMPMGSVWVLLAIIALTHAIDNIIIAPAVLSHNVDLHPLTVGLVLLLGGEALGVLGLLIAIPIASSIKVIAQEFYAHYQAQVR
jgi:putative permease